MKIVHLCLASFFPDGYSYQENMLPKFHKKQGHDVEVIASLVSFDKNGKAILLPNASSYINENEISVTRLAYKKPEKIYKKFRRYIGFEKILIASNPDVLFIHGCQFLDIDVVVRYLKGHKNVKVYVDNHADFSNSATNWVSKNILHKIIWRHCASIIEPYTEKFYGVLPIRVEFLKDIYKLPKNKCELLVMGADDDLVKRAAKIEVKEQVRKKYGIEKADFLVMTGGKIDSFKKQTLLLMDAINNISNPKIKLIVFGSVIPEMKADVDERCSERVKYIGWVKSENSYPLFAAADLVVFPGRHSVFWEQVAAQGIPMLCKRWNGTTHIDIGGNVEFLENDSSEEIQNRIEKLMEDIQKYEFMKSAAQNQATKEFSYDNIARRAIQSV